MIIPPEDLEPFGHILEVSGWVLSIVEGRTLSDLDSDLQFFLSLCRAIEVLGEAANRVSDATQRETPEIAWRRIIGMRNHLAHKYDDVSYEILWRAAQEHVPDLIADLRRLLPDDFAPAPLR